MKKIIIFSFATCSFLISCIDNHIPKCSDNGVKETAIKIIKEYFDNPYYSGFLSDTSLVDLKNIRISKIDKEIKKCNCDAEINIDNKYEIPITYTAQYTEDNNKIMVTVIRGLEELNIDKAFKHYWTSSFKQGIIKQQSQIESKPSKAEEINISAFLIFEDGSKSEINLIDNKTITLWNITAGEGIAEGKPSNKITAIFEGYAEQYVKITIESAHKYDEQNISLNGKKEIEIKDIGCEEITIKATTYKGYSVTKHIPFKCGK